MRHGLIGSVIDCIDHFILNYSLERFIDPGHITREPDIEGKTKMNKIKIAVAVATLLASPALAQSSRHVPAAISDVESLERESGARFPMTSCVLSSRHHTTKRLRMRANDLSGSA